MKIVVKKPDEQAQSCRLKKHAGSCSKEIQLTRWYHIPSTSSNEPYGTCEEFKYTGCGGNANNFLTKKECMECCIGILFSYLL